MAQLSEKKKRRWLVATAGFVCVLLVAAIVYRMSGETPEPEKETVGGSPANAATAPATVTPPIVSENPLAGANSSTPPVSPEVSIQPIQPSASAAPVDTAVSQGTEQALQATPVKPSAAPKETPKPKTTVTDPNKPPEYAPEETVQAPKKEPAGGESKDGKIYVPGFGWVEDNGPNQQKSVDGEGDINKQVGKMD